ncbi:hypothetical protein WMZ97_03350 [Lentibacillus sp. N15]
MEHCYVTHARKIRRKATKLNWSFFYWDNQFCHARESVGRTGREWKSELPIKVVKPPLTGVMVNL